MWPRLDTTPPRKQKKLTLNLSLKKVKGCLFVCLQRRISLTTETIWFSFTIQLISPGKVYNYFGGGYHHPVKRVDSIQNFQIKTKKWVVKFNLSPSSAPRGLQGIAPSWYIQNCSRVENKILNPKIGFWLMPSNYEVAASLYLISRLLDALDGHTARNHKFRLFQKYLGRL